MNTDNPILDHLHHSAANDLAPNDWWEAEEMAELEALTADPWKAREPMVRRTIDKWVRTQSTSDPAALPAAMLRLLVQSKVLITALSAPGSSHDAQHAAHAIRAIAEDWAGTWVHCAEYVINNEFDALLDAEIEDKNDA